MDEYPPGHRVHKSLFRIIQRQLNDPENRGPYIETELFAEAVRLNSNVPLPPVIRDYLVSYLKGDIKRPRGRKPSTKSALQLVRVAVAKNCYEHNKAWLRNREARGHTGCKGLRSADWWKEPIHVRAAILTTHQMRHCWPNVTQEHIMNEISSMFKSSN